MHTAKIVEWDPRKGFGYLRHQKGRLFIHRKDFAEHHKRPTKGDRIRYRVGTDTKGRRCAVQAVHVNDGGKITVLTWLGLVLLLLMPVLAWSHLLLVDYPRFTCLWLLFPAVNLATYSAYKNDKARARAKAWRTSEASLHFLELLGGWPAALLAQRQFRHKCTKTSFQTTYWLVVALHLYLATDYLMDWKLVGHAVRAIIG